jgi:hypothetical protein
MPGDKRTEHNPNIGWTGRLVLLIVVGLILYNGFGWMLR